MRKEFMWWIKSSIIERCKNYGEVLNNVQEQKLTELLYSFSDEDYETVSDSLCYAIEDLLLMFGYSETFAIRASHKWSD